MRYLWAFSCILAVVITLFAQSLYANTEEKFDQQPLIEELFHNMPFYVEYLAETPAFTSILSDSEKERLKLLVDYFRSIKRLPELDLSQPRAKFFLEPYPGEPEEGEKIAKTNIDEYSPIAFNIEKIVAESIRFDIPVYIQTLIHEFGHKLPDSRKQQGVLDSLAAKAGVFFKAYTKELKISQRWSIQSLSLPINWFYWPLMYDPYFQTSFRRRPNTIIFLKNESTGFQSLTEPIYERLAGNTGAIWPVRDTREEAFTDSQMHLDGWEMTSKGNITAYVRDQKRLQSIKGPRNPRIYEAYEKIVETEHQLQAQFFPEQNNLDLHVASKGQQDLGVAVRTVLEKESETSYRLTLPDYKSDKPIMLRLSTAQGLITIPSEKDQNSFRFTIPKKGSAQFVEIQSIQSASKGIQFLDRAYWFAIEKTPGRETKAKFMQMEINKKILQHDSTKWRQIKGGQSLMNSWGPTQFRIRLEKYRKIRQIRLVWAVHRLHFESHNLRRPHIFNPMEQRNVYAEGHFGTQFAEEYDIFEHVFPENLIQQYMQDPRTLTLQFDIRPKHIKEYSQAQYMMGRGWFFRDHVETVTTHHIKGKDTGNWQLLDVTVTDENLESTSLLTEPINIGFTNSGYPEHCEKWLLHREQYYDVDSLSVKGRRKPWKLD